MGIWKSLFGAKSKAPATAAAKEKKQGPLVRVFVFDSGPVFQDEGYYAANVLKSLLPETLGKRQIPLSFRLDEKMPSNIGRGRPPDLKRAMDYVFAWMSIAAVDLKLADGIGGGDPKYTFTWEEYHSDQGNRGILYAFYRLV